MTVRIARGKGANIEPFVSVPSTASGSKNRTGANSLTSDFAGRVGSLEKAPSHTVDHIDCPAYKRLDEIVRADSLGMAKQTFEKAAVVWQQVRRNSNALRERTHETVDEHVVALSKSFKCIVMRS